MHISSNMVSNNHNMPQSDVDASFRNGVAARPTDVFIAVMGVTGVGKSTFISKVAQQRVAIGHDLQACTKEVAVYSYKYNESTTVYLVDTPGFDDTNRTDTDVLREIAAWLTDSYANKIKLNGIIYLHRITDRRMQGSAKKNLFMFRKLCGAEALNNVILATTMWELVDPQEGSQREAELLDTEDFWGWMNKQGSQVVRHMNTRESAAQLIEIFASKHSRKAKVVLELQDEMVDQGKGLNETAIGKELEGEIAKEREKFKKELAQTQADMKEALASRDKTAAEELRRYQEETDRKMRALDTERNELKINMERLHEEKYQKLERSLQQAREESARAMRAMEEARREQERQRQQAEREKQERDEAIRRQKEELARMEERLEREARERKEKAAADEAAERLRNLQIATSPVKSGKTSLANLRSVTLSGDRYYFCGNVWDYWRTPQGFDSHVADYPGDNMYVAFGERNAWYRHYHVNGACWTQRSHDFGSVYPGLDKYLTNKKQYGCPKCISLGQNGQYFAHTDWGNHRKVPDDVERRWGNSTDVQCCWLGKNNAYVVLKKNGSLIWHLRGQYGTLDDKLRSRGALKHVALNIADGRSWAAFWEDGDVSYDTGSGSFPQDSIQKFGTKNFGTVWD